MEYFNNGTNDEIKSKINDIRLILRNNLRKKKYLEKRNNLSDNEKGKIYDDLVKLANTLDEKVKHKHSDRDDLDYFEIRELENLFTNDDYNGDNYYKLALIRSSFKNNYEYYEIRGDKDKKLSIKQYLYMVMPGLADLINKKKNDRVECKIQLNMGVNFISTNDTGEIRTFYVRSDNEEIRSGNETPEIISKLIKSFLSNYEEEDKTLRSGSNFVFDSVDLLAVNIHKSRPKKRKIIHKISRMDIK